MANAVTVPEEYIPIVDGFLWKKILVEGSGESPTKKSNVNVHYVGTLFTTGEKFDSSRDRSAPFNFKLGVGQVIKGWDEGVKTMKIGETAELVCHPEYGYGKNGSPPKIPGDSYLKFEIELLGFQESADNPTAKLALANKKKELGNAEFKAGDNTKASQAYKEGADLLQDMNDATEEQRIESKQLRAILLSNLAAAYLKIKENAKALDACKSALAIQPSNVKVIYRQAQAYLGLSEFEEAKEAAQSGLAVAPGDATFTSLLSVISTKQAAFKKQQQAAYSKMFS
ncbi:cytochrome P450 monooxygenase 9 [Podila humilis]|nr:cytochrome P450 monooxygenase 9 [Podila humilis]